MINGKYDDQICRWLETHREEIVEQLMMLVRIPSVRGAAEPGAPFGAQCRRVLEACQGLWSDFPTRLEAEKGYLLAHRKGDDKTIALMAHADVVPAGDGWTYTAPFDPIVKNGVLIGRGSGDNKAGVMAALCVMRMAEELCLPIRSSLLGFVGANEETGMADIQAFVASEPLPDIALIPDGYFPCSLGERSKLGLWVQCRTPFAAISDFVGGVSSTVVMPTVAVCLQNHPNLQAQLREKAGKNVDFVLDGSRLQVFGVPAHAATHPQEGTCAALSAAELLADCDALPEGDRRILQDLSALTDVYGSGLGIAHDDTRFGPLTVACGLAEMKDGCLRLNLDLRFGTELPSSQLIDQLQRWWDQRGWDMEIVTCREGMRVEDDCPIPDIVCEIYNEITGEQKEAFYMAGATHAHYLKNGISMGFCVEPKTPKIPLPDGCGGAHQSDEALDIDGFLTAIRILAHTVLRCDTELHSYPVESL